MMKRRTGSLALLACFALALQAPALAQDAGASGKSPFQEEIDEFLAKAEELIADRNYDAKETEHYLVRTDDPRLLVSETAELLESFRAYFDSFFSGRIELRKWEKPSEIFLFYSRYKYRQLLSGRAADADTPFTGHYMPMVGVIAAHTDSGSPVFLADLLVHEAAHHLIHRRLYGNEIQPSTWINEGLAQYFEYTKRDKSGKFLPGKLGPKEAMLVKDGRRPRRWAGDVEFNRFRKLIKELEPGFLDELIRLWDTGRFYGEGYSERYTASWVLVHYLLHADGGTHSDGFLGYIKKEAAGEGGPDLFYEAIGMTPEQLEAGIREHVKRKMKVR